MRIERDVKLDFCDVLFRPKRSTLHSRSEVTLEKTYKFKHSGATWSGVPIMSANMDGVGTLAMAEALTQHGLFTCLAKNYDSAGFEEYDGLVNFRDIAISTGTGEKDFNRLKIMLNSYPFKFICIDVANGYSEKFMDFVSNIREKYPNITIIAGNVVTPDVTEQLILRGADVVKVGIGQGSVCTTRIQTGVGYPQLSAVIECADAAHGLGGHIVADGGCVCPGDVAKAFGAGADFVMLGGMLAGHDEGGGKVITKVYTMPYTAEDGTPVVESKRFVQFYGMSSDTAMHKHHGGVADYRSSEGRTVEVPYRGAVAHTVKDLLGGIRSTCTYVGASNLKQLPKRTTFVQVNNGKQYNTVFTERT
jgi:GMP reductase